MSNEDFVSFEKALRDLKMQSSELKKLVSEGEIRAFRDGDSMKFKREDLETISAEVSEEEEFVFADALEDDTGMVTEELSDEDTLLADDDLLEEEEKVKESTPRASGSRSSRARAETASGPEQEPVWVTAAALIGTAVMIYGALVLYTVALNNGMREWIFQL